MAKFEEIARALSTSPLWILCRPEAYGVTWQWSTERDTPEWAKKSQWKQRTYTCRIFIILIGRKAIIRLDSCPWIATRNMNSTNKHALEVIADPEGAFR